MKVMIVSSSSKALPLFKDILSYANLQTIVQVNSIIEAKQKLHREEFDYIIIQPPLTDEFGVKGAKEIAMSMNVSILLLVKNEVYDKVLYQSQDSEIFVVSLPTSKQVLYQSFRFIQMHREKVKMLENEILKAKKKLKDEKTITRAKLLLMEEYRYSEEKAHRFIEKMAMDQSKTRLQIAMELLEKE